MNKFTSAAMLAFVFLAGSAFAELPRLKRPSVAPASTPVAEKETGVFDKIIEAAGNLKRDDIVEARKLRTLLFNGPRLSR